MAAKSHPEDIKAELRKRHRSIAAFERTRGLPCRSVKDVLRGKSRPRIAKAIADELDITIQDLLRAIHSPKWGR